MKKFFVVVFLVQSFVLFGMEIGQFLEVPNLMPHFSQEDSRALRQKRLRLAAIPATKPQRAVRIDPALSCKELRIKDRRGVCFNYAMMKTLNAYGINEDFKIVGCQDWQKQLYCFKDVKRYKKGDLAVYFDVDANQCVHIKHYGLVADSIHMRIKGKWGVIKGIYEHDMFTLPHGFGKHVVIMRLRKDFRQPGVAQSLLIKRIRSMEQDQWTIGALRGNEKMLLKIIAEPSDDAKKNQLNIVALLEQSTAVRVDVKDRQGMTPLMHAVMHNNSEVVTLLLAYGAKKGLKNNNGETAFTIARKNGSEKIQRLLMQ